MADKNNKGNKGTTGAQEAFVPSEEAILRELKQREVRKNYQTSDKAKEQRKAYQQKRYAETKAIRDQIKTLSPEKLAELTAKAKAAAAAAAKK